MVTISKIDAAKSQLIEAIILFFEERDPVSIHTLLGASLGILHDCITDVSRVHDNDLIFHKKTIYIKDEFRKKWQDSVRKDINFFKHADRDIKQGISSIEFNPEINVFYICEAIKALTSIEKNFWPAEFKVFFAWFIINYPKMIKEDEADFLDKLKKVSLKTKAEYRKAIDLIKQYPEFSDL